MCATALVTAKPLHIVHVSPSFGIGGVPLRTVRVINHLGGRCRHTIVSLDGSFTAAERISGSVDCRLEDGRFGKHSLAANLLIFRKQLAGYRPDILLTYNWGAIEWVLARRLGVKCRHIHFEAGFGVEEATRQLPRRVWTRRLALSRTEAVVVPSFTLEAIARNIWRLDPRQVLRIPDGIDLSVFLENSGARSQRPGGSIVIGTVAPLRPEKNVGRLLRAFARLDVPDCRLVVVGDGSERDKLVRLAGELGIADRVDFYGQRVITAALLNEFDVFSLSSDTEQMPNALIEAMAAGLPVAAVDVGDVRAMVAEENRPFIVDRDDGAALAGAIATLAGDKARRRRLGDLNRARSFSEYGQEKMIAAYERLLIP